MHTLLSKAIYSLKTCFICLPSSLPSGPLPSTVLDLWRLVWQEKCCALVMLTNTVEGGKVKCEQYWPESGSKSYPPFQVTITNQQILADYTVRSFVLTVSQTP